MLTAVFKDLERHCSDWKSSKNGQKTKPRLLDQQWSYRIQANWEERLTAKVVFALAQWKK